MKRKFLDWPFLIFLFFAIIGPVATKVYGIYNHILYLPPFTWMDTQPKVNPQESSDVFADGRGMQEAHATAIAQNSINTQINSGYVKEDLSTVYSNPLAITLETLKTGQKDYKTFCTPCHGDLGDGGDSGTLRGSHFAPPSLHSKKLKTSSDGLIYQIIVRGQNSMPSYTKQIPIENRWAIVHYIRALQRSKDAKESDLDRVVETTGDPKDEKNEDTKSVEGHH